MTARDNHKRQCTKLVVLAVLLGVSFIFSNVAGAVSVPLDQVIRIIFTDTTSGKYTAIIKDVRLPRNIISLLVGTCLALAGVIRA